MALAQHKQTAPTDGPQAGDPPADLVRVAYGNVVNVRSILSRGVTRIEIELPIESHIEATRLLFGADVLVMGVQLPKGSAYGITDGTTAMAPTPVAPSSAGPFGGANANAASGPEGRPARLASVRGAAAPVGGGEASGDIVRWLGARCAEADFQNWLQVRTEADAITRVRELCEVESRADIPKTAESRRLFNECIRLPYLEHQRANARSGGQAAPITRGERR